MPKSIRTGLDKLLDDPLILHKLGDKVGYLGHEASVTSQLKPGYIALHEKIGKRLDRLFGPQHGFCTLDQDNMIETDHQIHPWLNIPVYSLYSETRQPTPKMLEGLDSLIIDLQDVGTRVYTYIWTMYLIMQTCRKQNIQIIILDRPNPIGGLEIEGNFPNSEWYSFVCMDKIPMRHSLTIGELARLFNEGFNEEVNLNVITMQGWERWMHWNDTGLAWVNPSPNLPTPSGSLVYPGSVLIEGTTLSEGRGTTRSLELFGHPGIDPYKNWNKLNTELTSCGLAGFVLRPIIFKPTFDKFIGQACGGYQIHCTDQSIFKSWSLFQHMIRILHHTLDLKDFWIKEPYEYETKGLAIDYINGGTEIRSWIEKNGSTKELEELEFTGAAEYKIRTKEILFYTK